MCINFSIEKVGDSPPWLKYQSNILDKKNLEGDVKDKASIYVPAIGKVTIVIRNITSELASKQELQM